VTTTFTGASQVPSDVDYLADGNGVVFSRFEDAFDAWKVMVGDYVPLVRLFEVFGDLHEAEPCAACGDVASVGECCSSHCKQLCHRCYRRTHFVEVCIAGCEACAREGLPIVGDL
jgi:hypothetical protein